MSKIQSLAPAAAASVLCTLLLSSVVSAADEQQSLQFDIDSQSLATALSEFARQSQREILFAPEIVVDKRSAGVRGNLNPLAALTAILQNTGLTFSTTAQGAILVQLQKTTHASGSSKLRVAQADSSSPHPRDATESEVREFTPSIGIPEVLVVGSKILNVDIPRTRDDAQPYVVFDREQIARSGARDIQDFLKQRLPQNTQGSTGIQGSSVYGNLSEINLRGLGTGQTLILINGRRVASTSSSLLDGYHQPDLNGIPLSAVERIEVLPTTASGIYGGSATGGVLNVITRRDYNGIEADLTYDNTFDGVASTRRIDLASGFSLEDGRTSILLAASYVEGDPLLLGERSLLRESAVNSILANNPGFYFNASSPPTGATTNIRSVDGSPLTLRDGTSLNSAITFVPVGYNGVLSDGGAALVANAGNYNFDAPEGAGRLGTNRSILNDPTVKSIRGSAWRQFSANIEAFLEASASDNSQAIPSSDASTTFVVPATASTNPFGQNVRVAVASDIADGYLRTESATRQVAAGLIFRLPRDWAANLDYGWSHSKSRYSSPAPFSPALASAVTTGSVDLFRDPADIDFTRFVQDQELGIHTTPFKSTQNVVSLRMNGPVFSLPAGAAMLTGLVERRRDKFDEGFFLRPPSVIFRYPSRSQTVDSVYLEHWLPIVSSKNPMLGVHSMDLQLSGRWDRYTIDGSTGLIAEGGPITRVTNRLKSTNPTVALRYSPVSDLILRGSWGTGFTPPAANQLAPNAPIQAIGGLVDPRRGNEPVAQAQFVSGGSPDLRSEESESFSAGIVFKPSFLPSLRLSVDYTKIDKNDGIATLSSQGVIDNEVYLPGRIMRSAVLPGDPYGAGTITEIRGGPVNLSKAKVEALDFAFDYRLDLSQRGSLEFFLIATRNLHYRTQVSPDALEIENVGVEYLNPLKLKGNAGLTWQQDPWSVGWVARYFDSYLVSRNPTLAANQGGEGRVPSQTYHDLFATWRLAGSPVTEVQLGINNVFDKEPPYDAAYQNVGNVFGDPRLRSYEVSLKVQF